MSYRSSDIHLMVYSRHYFESMVYRVVPGMHGIFCAFHTQYKLHGCYPVNRDFCFSIKLEHS